MTATKWSVGIAALMFSTAVLATEINDSDPLERINRATFRFNKTFDRFIFKPVAEGYRFVLPPILRVGVSNFFDNLREVPNTINHALQGNPDGAYTSISRFVVNSTIGLAGLADPASQLGLEHKRQDFGQTLMHWGYDQSMYLMLPILGPSTVRDTIGIGVDYAVSGYSCFDKDWRYGLILLNGVSKRTELMSKENAMNAASLDEYVFIRNAYLQRRDAQQSGDLGVSDLDNYPN